MTLKLGDILSHPVVQAADPLLHSDPAVACGVEVRWVHSSEVLNIAPLLRGGELLLTGGEALATVSEQARGDYVRSLAARHIAALAVETGGPLATMPAELVRAARDAGLALIELRKVVPFVDITEAVNSELVNESMARLQHSDDISHMLSEEFANGGSISGLVAILARELAADVVLLDSSGQVAAAAGGDTAAPGTAGGRAEVLEFDIPVRGVVGASLRVEVTDGMDRELAFVVGGRGLDVLSLALLKYHPPTLREVGGAQLVRAVLSDDPPSRLIQLAEAAGVAPRTPLCVVIGATGEDGYRPGAVEKRLSREFQRVVFHAEGAEMVALVILDPNEVRPSRSRLLAELGRGLAEHPASFVVGPVAYSVVQAPNSLREARLAAQLAPSGMEQGAVIDAEALAVERFTTRVADPELVRNFVSELLGELLDHDARRGSRLVETLGTWLRFGCNTAETARELHLERQSLHYRLQRIFTLLGGDPRGTGRLAGLQAAVRMAAQLDVTAAR